MTASARDARLLKTARQILEEAGRPLSVRRILRAGEEAGRFEGQPSLEELRAALVGGVEAGVVDQARRGIFTLADGENEPAPTVEEPAATETAEEAPEPPKRRRRRRDVKADGPSETPATLDDAVALSEGSEREALKSKLWSRLQRKAAQVTEQPLAEADAAESPADGGAAAPAGERTDNDAEEALSLIHI